MKLRDRGLVIESGSATDDDLDEETWLRLWLIRKQYRTLRGAWELVTAETRRSLKGVPPKIFSESGHEDFFLCYVGWLHLFRELRGKDFGADLHAIKIRLTAYESVFSMLKALKKLHEQMLSGHYSSAADFYDALSSCAVSLGITLGYCRMLSGDQLNAGEYLLESLASRKLGASKRHAESRSMKEDARAWYRENKGSYRSLDATAQAVLKIVPVGFRTARAWLAEFKKEA